MRFESREGKEKRATMTAKGRNRLIWPLIMRCAWLREQGRVAARQPPSPPLWWRLPRMSAGDRNDHSSLADPCRSRPLRINQTCGTIEDTASFGVVHKLQHALRGKAGKIMSMIVRTVCVQSDGYGDHARRCMPSGTLPGETTLGGRAHSRVVGSKRAGEASARCRERSSPANECAPGQPRLRTAWPFASPGDREPPAVMPTVPVTMARPGMDRSPPISNASCLLPIGKKASCEHAGAPCAGATIPAHRPAGVGRNCICPMAEPWIDDAS